MKPPPPGVSGLSIGLWCSILLALATALPSPASPEELYDLRGPMPAPGTVIKQQTFLIIEKGDLIGRVGGETFGRRTGLSVDRRITFEYPETDSGGPPQFKIKVTRDRTTMGRSDPRGRHLGSNTHRNGPLHRKTIFMEFVDGVWKAHFLGDSTMTEVPFPVSELLAGTPGTLIYPEERVAPGQEWSVDPHELFNIGLGAEGGEISGELNLRFEGIETISGDTCAVVDVRLKDLKDEFEFSDGTKTKVKMSLEGKTHRSLRTGLDVSSNLSGKMSLTVLGHSFGFDTDILIEGKVNLLTTTQIQ